MRSAPSLCHWIWSQPPQWKFSIISTTQRTNEGLPPVLSAIQRRPRATDNRQLIGQGSIHRRMMDGLAKYGGWIPWKNYETNARVILNPSWRTLSAHVWNKRTNESWSSSKSFTASMFDMPYNTSNITKAWVLICESLQIVSILARIYCYNTSWSSRNPGINLPTKILEQMK